MDQQVKIEDIARDGGAKSRKLRLTYYVALLIGLGGLACVFSPAFVPVYDTYCGALLGLAGLYMTGNVGTKFVAAKAVKAQGEQSA